MAHKKRSHKTLRVHSARDTRCIISTGSHKLKLPKDIHTNRVQTDPTYPHPRKSVIIHSR